MESKEMKALFARWAEIMAEKRDYLIDLDSVAGDGDLGLVMSDGFRAVDEALAESGEADVGKLCYAAGKTLSKAAPSSMGTLLASGLMTAGKNLKGRTALDAAGLAELLEGIAQGVMTTGGAQEGEKTFLDAMCPAARAARAQAGGTAKAAATAALEAAKAGFQAATAMVAKQGRIAFRGENSVGIQDPGAAVAVLLVQGLDDVTA